MSVWTDYTVRPYRNMKAGQMANLFAILTVCLLADGHISAAQTSERHGYASPDSNVNVLPFLTGGKDFYRKYVRKTLPVLFQGDGLKSSLGEASFDISLLQTKFSQEKLPGLIHKNSEPVFVKEVPLSFSDWLHESRSEPLQADLDISQSKILEEIYLPVILQCKEYKLEYRKMRLLITREVASSYPRQNSDEMLYIPLGTKAKIRLFNSKYTSQLQKEGNMFGGLEHQDVTLEKGNILYVPKYWWSQIQTTGNLTVAIKIFFNLEFSRANDRKHQSSENIIEAIELHKMRLEKHGTETFCASHNQVLRRVLKINESDPKTLQLRIPRRPQRPDDVILASGYKMPVLGLGTALLNQQTAEIVKHALDLGYRLIDSAQGYPGSEAAIAQAIAESSVPRSEIFIVTKLHPRYLGYASTLTAIDMSLRRLNTDYIDLFLIHSKECDDFLLKCAEGEPTGTWEESWRAMEDAQRQGKIRSLGLSNFNVPDLKNLQNIAKLPISVLQNWFDPIHQDKTARNFCKKNGIRYMGYSTLGGMWTAMGLEENPILTSSLLTDISTHYDYFVSSLVLRWAIHRNVTVIPRTSNRNHLAQNLRALDMSLSDLDIAEIDSMATILDDVLVDLEKEEAESTGEEGPNAQQNANAHTNKQSESGTDKMASKDKEQSSGSREWLGEDAADDDAKDDGHQSSTANSNEARGHAQPTRDQDHKTELK